VTKLMERVDHQWLEQEKLSSSAELFGRFKNLVTEVETFTGHRDVQEYMRMEFDDIQREVSAGVAEREKCRQISSLDATTALADFQKHLAETRDYLQPFVDRLSTLCMQRTKKRESFCPCLARAARRKKLAQAAEIKDAVAKLRNNLLQEFDTVSLLKEDNTDLIYVLEEGLKSPASFLECVADVSDVSVDKWSLQDENSEAAVAGEEAVRQATPSTTPTNKKKRVVSHSCLEEMD